jgi:hypothetical protein
MDIDKTENENWQLGRKLPAHVVDTLAAELAQEYSNLGFLKWYCRAIYDLGLERISAIRARVKDARSPGKLFSHYVKQERLALMNKHRLEQMRKPL